MSVDRKHLKTVLITGGGSGIGFEIAKQLLATQLYRLVLLSQNRQKLEAALKMLGGSSDQISSVTCDLRDSKQIKTALERITATHKGIYGLINNAGIYPLGGISSTREASWDEAMAINLKAPFLLAQALAPLMAKNSNGGRIINISSTAGILPNHFALAYSVSKAALVHLTRTLAKELGKDNITVNCICPGIVRSPIHETYHHSETELEEFYAKRGTALPLGRIGEPADVTGAVKFFLSEDSAWITGDVLVVDGGRLLL